MTNLTENPWYIKRFDEEAEPFRQAGLQESSTNSQNTNNIVEARLPFCLLQWRRGES